VKKCRTESKNVGLQTGFLDSKEPLELVWQLKRLSAFYSSRIILSPCDYLIEYAINLICQK